MSEIAALMAAALRKYGAEARFADDAITVLVSGVEGR